MIEGLGPRKEVLHFNSLDFIVIGSGQVVDKYWLPSQKDGSVNITDIVSLEPEESFRQRNPLFLGQYYNSTSLDDTFGILASYARRNGDLNIANVATSGVRLGLTHSILSDDQFRNTRLFLEKPYASNRDDLNAFIPLIENHSSRLHFSGKYANGRANILYPHLPTERLPVKITGRLIEGTDYFKVVKDRVLQYRDHPYLHDGPELDLGFHLLDIIGAASQRFGGIRALRTKKAYDLSQSREDFEPNYGFGVDLELQTESNETISVDLQAGKVDGPNDRYIEFDYGDVSYSQRYSVKDATDPVYEVKNGVRKQIDQHSVGYNYYTFELNPNVFCHQSPKQQLLGIYNTDIALQIKERRLNSSLHRT